MSFSNYFKGTYDFVEFDCPIEPSIIKQYGVNAEHRRALRKLENCKFISHIFKLEDGRQVQVSALIPLQYDDNGRPIFKVAFSSSKLQSSQYKNHFISNFDEMHHEDYRVNKAYAVGLPEKFLRVNDPSQKLSNEEAEALLVQSLAFVNDLALRNTEQLYKKMFIDNYFLSDHDLGEVKSGLTIDKSNNEKYLAYCVNGGSTVQIPFRELYSYHGDLEIDPEIAVGMSVLSSLSMDVYKDPVSFLNDTSLTLFEDDCRKFLNLPETDLNLSFSWMLQKYATVEFKRSAFEDFFDQAQKVFDENVEKSLSSLKNDATIVNTNSNYTNNADNRGDKDDKRGLQTGEQSARWGDVETAERASAEDRGPLGSAAAGDAGAVLQATRYGLSATETERTGQAGIRGFDDADSLSDERSGSRRDGDPDVAGSEHQSVGVQPFERTELGTGAKMEALSVSDNGGRGAGSGSFEQSAEGALLGAGQILHSSASLEGTSGDRSRSEIDGGVRSGIPAGSNHSKAGGGVQEVRQGARERARAFSSGIQTSLFDNFSEEVNQGEGEDRSDRLDGRDQNSDQGVVSEASTGEGESGSLQSGEGKSGAVTSDPEVYRSFIGEQINNRVGINFHLDWIDASGGDKARVARNVQAIRVLKQGDGLAETERQKILSGYSGWGGLSTVFDGGDKWKSEYEELKSLLSEEEFSAAASSSLTAYYTPLSVIDGIYDAFKRFGFEQGDEPLRLLEPSCGIGHFMGRCPDKNAFFTGVELDPLSADIAKALYPEHEILNQGFETLKNDDLQKYDYDAVIGNVPFDNYSLFDAQYKNTPLENASIHNFFIAKSIDELRLGGIGAFVVSSSFLDSDNPRTEDVRNYIADRADLLGAIRLPNKTFGESNAAVTSDIVFFRRHLGKNELSRDWTKTDKVLIRDEYGVSTSSVQNQYFIFHPDQIIGRMELVNGRYGPAPACVDDRFGYAGYSLKGEITSRLAAMPEKFFAPKEHRKFKHGNCDEKFMSTDYYQNLKPMQYFIGPDNKLYQKDSADEFYHAYKVPKGVPERRVRGMIKVRDELRTLINAEKSQDSTDELLSGLRADLNRDYDAYVKEFGFLNAPDNVKYFSNDPESPLILSLENNYQKAVRKNAKKNIEGKPDSCTKADIFFKRVIVPNVETNHVDTAFDGLIASINHRGKVDIPYIANLLWADEREVIDELANKDEIFLNPASEDWEIKSKYLSGNVRKKLKLAREKAADDQRYAHNVTALQRVLPADLDAADISVSLNSMWIPDKYINDFVRYISKPNAWDDDQQFVKSMPLVGGREFLLDKGYRPRFNWSLSKIDGTSLNGVDLDQIFSDVLQNKQTVVRHSIRVTGEDGKPTTKSVVDTEATIAAQQKAQEFQDLFNEWVWQDPERRQVLTKIYNEKFNSFVPPHYDGSHLQLVGTSNNVQLRPHQLNAVLRNIQEGYGLIDHVVGAGKTMVAIASIMEQKRLGLVNKPMVIVPNHLLYQWRDDFYKLYPDAKVLILTNEDFKTAASRELFTSKAAIGSWDAIIMTHETFNRKIKMPPEYEKNFFNERMLEFSRALNQAEDRDSQSKLQKHIKFFEKKLNRLRDTEAKKFNSLDFTDLGIDCLVVDEAHAYKNLPYLTALQYKGMGNSEGSIMAYDLSMKTQYLQEQHNGKGVFFLTGTPVSNTLCELYNMQKYLQPQLLRDLDIYSLDGWISVFGEAKTEYVLNSTATNYTLDTRLSGIKNAPELMSMYNMMADVVTQGDLNEQARAQGKRPYVPNVKGGRPKNVVVEPSPDQQEYMKKIVHRMENLPKDPSEDNPLKITNDARKAGLDYRLIDPLADDFENSKVNVCVDNVFKIWERSSDDRGTQLVFCDLSVPKKKNSNANIADDNEYEVELEQFSDTYLDDEAADQDALIAVQSNFSVYNDIKEKLIDKGVPPEEIAFIHDAKTNAMKFKLYDDVNAGKVRILLGSTGKMGAGMNVQRRLVAAHHLDAPWRPSDIEQRNGRIIRQGNMFYENDPNFEVEIYNYATSRTYDARMWQTIESKARMIEDFRKGNLAVRNFDDISSGAATAAEMKAIASGNPLILAEIKLAQVEKKYLALEKAFKQKKYRMEDELLRLRKDPPEAKLKNFYARKKMILDQLPKDTRLTDKGQPAIELYVRGELMQAAVLKQHFVSVIGHCLDEPTDYINSGHSFPLGSYRGFKLIAQRKLLGCGNGFRVLIEHEKTGVKFAPENLFYDKKDFENLSVLGFYQRLNNFIDKKMYEQFDFIESSFKADQNNLEQLENDVNVKFKYATDLKIAKLNHQNVLAQLELMQKNSDYQPEWHPYKMPNSADSLDDAISLPSEVFDEIFEASVDLQMGKDAVAKPELTVEPQESKAVPLEDEPLQNTQHEEVSNEKIVKLLQDHSYLSMCSEGNFATATENLRRELKHIFPGEKISVTVDNKEINSLKVRFANPLIASKIADHVFKFRDDPDFQQVFGKLQVLDLDFDVNKYKKEVDLADRTGKIVSYDKPSDFIIVDNFSCMNFFDSQEARDLGIRPFLDWEGKNEATLGNNHIIPTYSKIPRLLIEDGTLDRLIAEKKVVSNSYYNTCADIARERKLTLDEVKEQMQQQVHSHKASCIA